MKKKGKKWAKGKYPFTSAGSMRRLLTTGVTVPFPVSTISNIAQKSEIMLMVGRALAWVSRPIVSGTRILTRLEIDIESSHEIGIEYSGRVTTLVSSTRAGSESRYENPARRSV